MKISELPEEVKLKALEYQKNETDYYERDTDILSSAFEWGNTKEGYNYWMYWDIKLPEKQTEDLHNIKQYYDNSKGSIYKFCNDQNLNAWEFDLIKRIVRCRKKGQFKEDLEKTKILIDLYLNEYEK